jgi:hypothetical protein
VRADRRRSHRSHVCRTFRTGRRSHHTFEKIENCRALSDMSKTGKTILSLVLKIRFCCKSTENLTQMFWNGGIMSQSFIVQTNHAASQNQCI